MIQGDTSSRQVFETPAGIQPAPDCFAAAFSGGNMGISFGLQVEFFAG
jgi:hypothetical protein